MTYLEKNYLQADIQEFIDSNKEESINLEFKRAESLKTSDSCRNEIAKDVSAFANSDGGIIIYGIEEINHKASSFSFIDGNNITKEWLDQIISSRIQRKIDGLIIDPIRYNNEIEKSIYVVKIPRSFNAPHMTSNKKFYKRHNFESIEMEEYEIRDLYSRHSLSRLKICKPKITLSPRSMVGSKYVIIGMLLRLEIENIGTTIEKNFKLEIKIPRHIASNSSNHGPLFSSPTRHEGDFSIYRLPNTEPIFQEDILALCSLELNINKRTYNDFIEKEIIMTLFYTDGIDREKIVLKDHMMLKERPILFEDFD